MRDETDEVADDPATGHFVAPDPVLQGLVHMANLMDDPDTATGVTLTVGGATITGDIVPAWRWFELVTEQVRDAAPESGLLAMFETMTPPVKEATQQSIGVTQTAHVNLANAHWLTLAGLQPDEGFLWRGRLAAISGWTLGTLSFRDSEAD